MEPNGVILHLDELVVEPKYVEVLGEKYELVHPADADPITLAKSERLRKVFTDGPSQAFSDSYEFAEAVCAVIAPSIPRAAIRKLRRWQAFDLAQALLTFWNTELTAVQAQARDGEEGGDAGNPPTSASSSPGFSASTEGRPGTG